MIRIIDMQGRITSTELIGNISGRLIKEIDISDYGKGMYMLLVITDYGIISRKVVVK